MTGMRPISFALLSAALLLSGPLASHAQSGGGGQQPRVSGRQVASISLGGRYLASRVADIARPGSVLTTRDVREAVDGEFQWSSAGAHRLKGIRAQVPLYRARRPSELED